MPDIFEPRQNVKPYEYPELIKFAKAIQHSAWTIEEFVDSLSTDKMDFHKDLTNSEREAIKRTMLAISHVEHAVKTFWARLDMRMEKPEISFVGSTFAGNEVVHSFAYSELLEQLGLNGEFEKLLGIPAIANRTKYLKKYLEGINSRSNKEFTKSLILFTLLVENVSLFSQFLIISSFSKYRNQLKTISKIINATAREEILHGRFGGELVNIIRSENPEWFDAEMEAKIRRSIHKAFDAEMGVLDWIFEKGDLPFISREAINEFLKLRLNDSLGLMNYGPEFETSDELLVASDYLTNMLLSTVDSDFFDKRPIDYQKGLDYNPESLFD